MSYSDELSPVIILSMNSFVLLIFLSANSYADDCKIWFADSKVKPGPNCELKCSSQLVDMGTFDCPNRCTEFCEAPLKEQADSDPLPYLKGISKGDREAIDKYPRDAITVYRAKEKVDDLTKKLFGKPGRNDESDAFRHFAWAALLAKELGQEKAKYFLDAHEKDPTQPKSEMQMDLANNQRGLDFAKSQINAKIPLELDQIEKAGLSELREGKLKILSPSKKKIPDGYYSK